MIQELAGWALMALPVVLRGAWAGGDSGFTLLVNLVLFFAGLEMVIRSPRPRGSR